jgi:hypothetical protein
VVPIGGRLGGAAAPALEESELEENEPTRVGAFDLAELEAKTVAAEREAKRAAEAAEAKRHEAEARPPTGKTGLKTPTAAPPPKRPETGKTALPAPIAHKPAPAPAPLPEPEHDLPIDEPSFAEVPAALAAPAAVAPVVSAPTPAAFVPPAPAPAVAAASVPPREERRGGGVPIPAMIAIAGATAFGAVMAYMIGTRYLGPTTVTPAVATVQPTSAPPPTTAAVPPTAPVTAPPETTAAAPPATTETPAVAPPETTATGRPRAGTGTHPPPTTAGTTTAPTGAGAQAATKTPPTGRFADFVDDPGGGGPATIATTGRRSLADEPEGSGGGGGTTRSQQELTADQIRAVITRERPAVNRCWESELRRIGQAATVRLDVDLTIGGSGTVTSVATRGQSVGTLSDCIERNVRRWRFPPTSGTTQTSFPLVFSGTE